MFIYKNGADMKVVMVLQHTSDNCRQQAVTTVY